VTANSMGDALDPVSVFGEKLGSRERRTGTSGELAKA